MTGSLVFIASIFPEKKKYSHLVQMISHNRSTDFIGDLHILQRGEGVNHNQSNVSPWAILNRDQTSHIFVTRVIIYTLASIIRSQIRRLSKLYNT